MEKEALKTYKDGKVVTDSDKKGEQPVDDPQNKVIDTETQGNEVTESPNSDGNRMPQEEIDKLMKEDMKTTDKHGNETGV